MIPTTFQTGFDSSIENIPWTFEEPTTPYERAVVIAYGSDGLVPPWKAEIDNYAKKLADAGILALVPDYFEVDPPTPHGDRVAAFSSILPRHNQWAQVLRDALATYGGIAYFEIDDTRQCLRLTHVQAPQSDVELAVDPNDARFRHAEDTILATVYFYVVSGKHLVEIHMVLNLVEVALFNSFDAKRQWFHPVQLALYPHLFAHELAEELTTQNLLEDKAVFPQIFATTNASLMRHLNDRFGEYELANDEDFDRREEILLTGRNGQSLKDVLPRSSLIWEKKALRRDLAGVRNQLGRRSLCKRLWCRVRRMRSSAIRESDRHVPAAPSITF